MYQACSDMPTNKSFHEQKVTVESDYQSLQTHNIATDAFKTIPKVACGCIHVIIYFRDLPAYQCHGKTAGRGCKGKEMRSVTIYAWGLGVRKQLGTSRKFT